MHVANVNDQILYHFEKYHFSPGIYMVTISTETFQTSMHLQTFNSCKSKLNFSLKPFHLQNLAVLLDIVLDKAFLLVCLHCSFIGWKCVIFLPMM